MKQRPKIALMSYPMDNRVAKGMALYTRKLVSGLLEGTDFDLYLVHFDKVEDPLYQKGHEILIPKVTLPYASRFFSQLLFFWKYRNNQFDIVHWFQPRLYPLYWLFPAKKLIITMHGSGDVSAPTHFVFSRSVFNFVLKYFHRWIDVFIVDCEDAKSEVANYYSFPLKKITVIYLGGGENYVPLPKDEANATVSKKYGITGKYILDVSRLQPHKNIVRLIESYTLLRKEHPEHTEKLVIVGGTAGNRTDEFDTAKKSEFSANIIFVDFVETGDLNAIYSAAEIFVFPSLSEGFGLPVVEAMASGVPVITSNITSMPEIGGDAVVTIDPFNIEELKEKMHEVLSDADLRNKMIEKGLTRAKEFTWKKTVEATEELYKKELGM